MFCRKSIKEAIDCLQNYVEEKDLKYVQQISDVCDCIDEIIQGSVQETLDERLLKKVLDAQGEKNGWSEKEKKDFEAVSYLYFQSKMQ